MAALVYEERATSPKAWRTVYLVSAVVVVLCGLFGGGSFVDGALAGVLAVVIVGGIALLTLWSMERYGRIRLTREQLRVGRHAVAVADVDPRVLLSQAAADPALSARYPQSFGVDVSDAPVPGHTPLMGGAWSEPVGHVSLLLLTRDGAYRRVPTRRPDALLEALLQVTVPSS